MVLGWIFPRQGGGWARRYLRFRKDVLTRVMETPDRYPCAPVSLFDFTHRDDAADALHIQAQETDGWRISDDRVIGGFSKSKAVLIRSPVHLKRYNTAETICNQDVSSEVNSTDGCDDAATELDSAFASFLRWSGRLDTTVGLASNAQRSGFAALRSPEFPLDGANLRGNYGALEIACRSDGRHYKVNLHVLSAIPGDIYQGDIMVPPTESEDDFETLILPFSEFALTSRGREREFNRVLDSKVCIESVGLALMDRNDGNFAFDLARIRCVNLSHGKVFEQLPPTSHESSVPP